MRINVYKIKGKSMSIRIDNFFNKIFSYLKDLEFKHCTINAVQISYSW